MSDTRVSISDIQEVATTLYGDGAWEITKALSQSQKKDRATKIKENIALATNAGGAVAGPAAIYGAARSRKRGGFFRDVGRTAGRKADTAPKAFKSTLRGAGKVASSLDKPMSRKAKIGAVAAGGTMVGLQGLNMAGDTIAAQMIRDKQKADKKVSKALGILKPLTPKAPKPPKMATAVKKPKMPTVSMPKSTSVKSPKMAPVVRKNYDFEARYEITKADTDKRQVFGWASVVEVNGEPVIDLQGDYATIDVIEKAAYDYVHTSRKGGDMHQREGTGVIHKSDLVESFVVTPEKKQMLGLPDSTPTGWWVGFKVNDDDLWSLVKDGKRPQFSIHGSGQRVEKVL